MPAGSLIWKMGKESSSPIYYYHVMIIAVVDIMAQKGVIAPVPMAFKPILIMLICVILFYYVPLVVKKRIKMPSST